MTKFSANLGFLWSELSLPEAIRAAKNAGFDAVECHWPYEIPAQDVKIALEETGLKMLGLNTDRGNLNVGENGKSALVGREEEAREAIDQAIAYANIIGALNVHVMAGFSSGQASHDVFIQNLKYATNRAAKFNITILIEPLNHIDVAGYFLSTTPQAKAIIGEVGVANLKLMFDCYHVQIMEGDLINRLKDLEPIIGHIQFASVPDRGPPNQGEIDYRQIFRAIKDIGYDRPLGAEYHPVGTTEATLDWLSQYR